MKEPMKYLLTAFMVTTAITAGNASASSIRVENSGGVIQDNTFTDFDFELINRPLKTTRVALEIDGLTHNNLFELELFLISPDQKVLTLAQALIGNQMTDTRLFDGGSLNIDLANSPYTGDFKPSGEQGIAQDSNISSFAGYNGINPNGTWTLRIYDLVPGNEGELSGATLIVASVPEPLTLLGSAAALGFGAFFKKELSKKSKQTEKIG
ncbi:MAG TPA: hypothetical protein DCF68_03030 [Cyanothece sp. UBA12306]|nr:hypothetical protein [Cyanothece sp. UBA12306]